MTAISIFSSFLAENSQKLHSQDSLLHVLNGRKRYTSLFLKAIQIKNGFEKRQHLKNFDKK